MINLVAVLDFTNSGLTFFSWHEREGLLYRSILMNLQQDGSIRVFKYVAVLVKLHLLLSLELFIYKNAHLCSDNV